MLFPPVPLYPPFSYPKSILLIPYPLHIFISYRVKTDQDIARKLCQSLQKCFLEWDQVSQVQVKCFWDAQDITNASDWKETFLYALDHCLVFVPIVSEATLAPFKRISVTDVSPDNVLLEYEVANQLAKDGKLVIFPILIGGTDRGMFADPKADPTPRVRDRDGRIALFNWFEFASHMFPNTTSVTQRLSHVRVLWFFLPLFHYH